MRIASIGVLAVVALVVVSCGGGGGATGVDGDEPMVQITSEGGFAPVEVILNSGPRYTLLADGTLIFQGVQTVEYPGPLVPPYMSGGLDEEQMREVMSLIGAIGLPEIEDVSDDAATATVADATTEVVTYWDESGEHRLAVYALGIEEAPSVRNRAFLDLIETLDGFASTLSSEPYLADRVRVVAGPGTSDPQFEDIRDWPLQGSDLSAWQELPNEWRCTVIEGDVPDVFADATQATIWEHPEDGETKLLVRPLHPGEPDCPS